MLLRPSRSGLSRQVYDQHLDYVVLQPTLFSITPAVATPTYAPGQSVAAAPTASSTTPTAYELLNSASASESSVDDVVDRIARGLFSVVATLGQLPIVRCPRGGAAEMVARKLDARLREQVANRSSTLFTADSASASSSFSRPLLIILDRNIDLVPMVAHSWTYQALVSDVLDSKLNRVTVQVRAAMGEGSAESAQAPEAGKLLKRSYDLDAKDFFWAKNAASPFPQVAEEIDSELTKLVAHKNDRADAAGTRRTRPRSRGRRASATSTTSTRSTPAPTRPTSKRPSPLCPS